jgi:hypothetical protein
MNVFVEVCALAILAILISLSYRATSLRYIDDLDEFADLGPAIARTLEPIVDSMSLDSPT